MMVSSVAFGDRAERRVVIALLCVVLAMSSLAGCSSVDAGRVWSWGLNKYDALGYKTTAVDDMQDTPELIPALTDITRVIPGCSLEDYNHYCAVYAIDTQGRLWGWGLQMGLFRSPRPNHDEKGRPIEATTLAPTMILDSVRVVDVAFTENEVLVVDDQGDVWTWGCGQYARGAESPESCSLPDYSQGFLSSWPPVRVSGVSGIVDIAVSESVGVLAVDASGQLWNWDDSGSPTDLTTEDGLPPVVSVTITNRVDVNLISVGYPICGYSRSNTLSSYVAVVGTDGSVWEWTVPPHLSATGALSPECVAIPPHKVVGLSNIVSVAAPGKLVAVDRDGAVWSESTDGTVSRVAGLSDIVQMGSDRLALDKTGRVYQNADDQSWHVVQGLSNISFVAATSPHYLDDAQMWAVQGSPLKGDTLSVARNDTSDGTGIADRFVTTPAFPLTQNGVSTPWISG